MAGIILSADSTCDLSEQLRAQYSVNIIPLHINLAGKSYKDGVDITPDDIYETYNRARILPKTSAPNPQEYIDYFRQWTDEGYEVIHLCLGSGLSSSYQNCRIAAMELGHVYPIDSGNLSTGIGHLIIEAAVRIAQGLPVGRIVEEVEALRANVRASFVIDSMTYLYEGGRCSALAAFGANLLSIKPSIEVDPADGKMKVGTKYRGALPRVLKRYVADQIGQRTDLKPDRIFLTHSGTSAENIELVRQLIEEEAIFQDIIITRAGCTISSHCGPDTVGIMYMTQP